MSISNATLLRKGKVKDLYALPDERLLFVFSDRVSAFDVILGSEIPMKGEILAHFAEFWFQTLGAPNHMIALVGKNQLIVKKLKMIPIECIVRGYMYGSLYERMKTGKTSIEGNPILASRFSEPVFDPTTKSERKDLPITKEEALSRGLVTSEEFDRLRQTSISLYEKMEERVSRASFILGDIKFEFGRDKKGEIVLADSLGPDEFRLWPMDSYSAGKIQESFDKQLIRDWLTEQGFKATLETAALQGRTVGPPVLPPDLIRTVTERYLEAYAKITGRSL